MAAAAILACSIGSGNLPAVMAAEQQTEATQLPGEVESGSSIHGHAFLSENEHYRYYLNEEDLSLVVENKENGAFMESSISYDDGRNNASWMGAMRSAVVMTLISLNDDTLQADLVNDQVSINLTKAADGFEAELYWDKYQLGFTLEVMFTEDGLTACIPEASIREDGSAYTIGTVTIYPYMGNSYLDEKEGYLFVPDGNGALVYLNNKEGRFASGYSGMIYGSDTGFVDSEVKTLLWDEYNTISDAEQVLAPVFGIAHTDDEMAFLGIVEAGQERASIDVMPNGVSVDYNRAYARFVLRKMYTQPTSNNSTSNSLHIAEDDRSHSDLRVRFRFLSGEEASYAGMANSYREYLLENGELAVAEDPGYRTRIDFLGTERENFLLGTTGVEMTSAEDIREIYADLKTQQVTDLLTVYKGWQKGGLWDLPVKRFAADSAVGGTGAVADLVKDAEADGIRFYLFDDALRINPDEQNATFNVVKKVNKRRYEETTYKDVYDTLLYLTPTRSQELSGKLAQDLTGHGIGSLALAGVTDHLFTYTYNSVKYTRYETAQHYRELADSLAGQMNLAMESPFSYLWKDTGAFLDMPLDTSSYILEDAYVPFLSIVLKGVMPVYAEYVNFEANKEAFFLKMIESGSYPSFLITKEDASKLIYTNSNDIYSSQYETYRDMIVSYTEELKAFQERVADATITRHELLEQNVRRVTYSNGVTVLLNYGQTDQTVDGTTVPALSYTVQ